jgi:hypothetical protein
VIRGFSRSTRVRVAECSRRYRLHGIVSVISPRAKGANSRWNADPAATAAAGRCAAKVFSLLIYVDSLSWIFASAPAAAPRPLRTTALPPV